VRDEDTGKLMGWGGIITSVIIIIGLFVLISWMYKNGWDPTIVFFFGLPFAIWLLYESVTSVKEKLEIDINLKCLFGHQWNNICKCKRCGEIRDEMHNWVSLDGKFKEKCSSCGKERERFTREEVKKLNDQQVLKEYVLNATSWDLEIVREVLIKITNQAYLKEIAINGSDRHIRLKALAKITDQVFLKELVLKDSDRGVRWIAVENITDQAFLKKIALEDSDRDVRKVALTKITDKAFLQENASINSYRK